MRERYASGILADGFGCSRPCRPPPSSAQWVDGRINGFGTLTYADGDRYIGQWVDGKMNGQGTYIYADGDKYEGEWKDDKRHGKGTVTYRGQDGTIVEKFEGDWYVRGARL